MDPDLEAAIAELIDQLPVEPVTFRDEVERRSKALVGIQVGDRAGERLAIRRLDVMRDRERKRVSMWPEVNVGGGSPADAFEHFLRDRPLKASVAVLDGPPQTERSLRRCSRKPAQIATQAPGK